MNYLHIYKSLLPYAVIPSVSISYIVSINENDKHCYPQIQVINMLGLMSVGTLIGLTYPISMPLLAGRYLYRNRV
jgi:hypothetical protein